jgi:hypothetical protein
MEFQVTTQEKQEQGFASAWERMGLLTSLRRRRLLAALHYFYVAVRLDRSSSTPGEFMAEVILNLSKVLEVLFPPGGNGKSRDAVRTGLQELGYAAAEIEGLFLPAMALRNEIDVGHVSLALLTRRHLSVIHAYTQCAERAFRELLERTLNAVAAGKWDVEALTDPKPSESVLEIIERLTARFGPEAK